MWRSVFAAIFCSVCFLLYVFSPPKTNWVTNTSIEVTIPEELIYNQTDDTEFMVEKKLTKKKTRHHVPKFMLDLYEKSVRRENNGNFAFPDVVRSVVPKSAAIFNEPHFGNAFGDSHLLVFQIPKTSEDEHFLSAELKILTIVQIDGSVNGIERLLKISIYDEVKKSIFFIDKLKVYHSNNTWISFNVTKPVNDLIKANNTEAILKIVVSIKSYLPFMESTQQQFKLSLLPIEDNLEHDYPILLLSYSIKKEQQNTYNDNNKENMLNKNMHSRLRTKRNIEEDYEEATNKIWNEPIQQQKKLKKARNTCKRKPLYVNFSEIEYDSWIVQPSGYEAYQCQGKCFYPVGDHLTPTKHAILQALLHNLQPTKAVRSCCVPTKLDSISILYIDRGVLTYRFAYKDMVVAECGCR